MDDSDPPSFLVPLMSLGLWDVPNVEVPHLVEEALRVGYRSIDTSSSFGQEETLGQVLHTSGIGRDELFLTTKVSNDAHGFDKTKRAVYASLERLGTGYLDMCLIEWPMPFRGLYQDSWAALVSLREEGLIHSVGVANFLPDHIDELSSSGTVPILNQFECHPTLQQREIERANAERGVISQAHTPLGTGQDFDLAIIHHIASLHDATPAQIILAWHRSQGRLIVPSTHDVDQVRTTWMSTSISLGDEELALIDSLEEGRRLRGNPATEGSEQRSMS